jgi:type IV pilus biogenesis protein PilP
MRSNFLYIILGVVLLLPAASYAQNAPAPSVQDVCPDAPEALRASPDDLSKVQADIDRFTLCVERAQLLKRLNDLATENEDALVGASPNNPGFSLNNEPVDFDPFDAQALLNGGNEPVSTTINTPQGPQDMLFETDDWVILNVFGTGNDLSAKLAKNDGSFMQVKTGDELPDGATVSAVSAVKVSVTEDGKTRTLRWYEGLE